MEARARIQLGHYAYIEPISNFGHKPCVGRPTYSDKPAMVSSKFARSSSKHVPGCCAGH